jgi:hypothetical protein
MALGLSHVKEEGGIEVPIPVLVYVLTVSV